MSYWNKYFFNDRKFWLRYLFIGSGFLIFIDVFTYAYSPPGYFNLWPTKIILFIAVPVLARFIYLNFKNLNRIKKTEREAPLFEKMREEEIRNIIRQDTEFTTFCYECVFFNPERRACRRDRVLERVKEIRIGNRQYCLYWRKVDPLPGNENKYVSE